MNSSQFHNFAEITQTLSSIISRKKKSAGRYSLDSMKALMDALGNPQDTYKVIHIAGTSGKTSTAYFVASLLQGTGKIVGLSVSPHIDSIAERVQINGRPLIESEYCKEFTLFISAVQNMAIKPTYFEMLLAFSFWEFARKNVDYAVVEVGLGGLLDSSNVIQRSDKVCVITDIGMDHTEILGDTLALIARQKAGIAHKQNNVFVYSQGSEIDKAIRQTILQNQAILHVVSEKIDFYSDVPDFQTRNFNLALQAAKFVISRDNLAPLRQNEINNSMHVCIPARMEIIEYGKTILILDGSHNSQKMNTLVRSIQNKYPNITFTILIAMTSGKDLVNVIVALKQIAQNIIVTQFLDQQDLPKVAIKPNIIEQECHSQGIAVKIAKKPIDGLEMLLKSENQHKLITGSFYLLNHVRPVLRERGLMK